MLKLGKNYPCNTEGRLHFPLVFTIYKLGVKWNNVSVRFSNLNHHAHLGKQIILNCNFDWCEIFHFLIFYDIENCSKSTRKYCSKLVRIQCEIKNDQNLLIGSFETILNENFCDIIGKSMKQYRYDFLYVFIPVWFIFLALSLHKFYNKLKCQSVFFLCIFYPF